MAMSTRKKMKIPDKAWLETLKFLMGPQWLKMRFVSRQIAEVVRSNISDLPRILIDNVKFSKTIMRSKPSEMVFSGIVIPPNAKRGWFMKRGINLGLQQQDGAIAKYGDQQKLSILYKADVNELAGELKTTVSGQEHRKSVLFSAAFNPDLNEDSWASTDYFLNLIYNPRTYIKKVKMHALNKNLTDAFFLGEHYGSYIHCGKFTLIGDLCDSLPWIQKNVRSDTIYFPGDFIDVQNSYREASNFLLDTPWMCDDRTGNVKIEFESVQNWKWFIKILIKKFRTLATIQHATPWIEFHCKHPFEKPNLNFLVWDPEVVKLKPEDSQDAEAAYMISSGRNRMEITIFKRRDIEAVKMYGFPGYFDTEIIEPIYEVTVQMYTIQSAIPSRKKVHIGNDTWLEALKFLTFRQWSKAFYVSRQLAGVVQGNISCLPRIIVDSATISEMMSACSNFVVSDDKIPTNEEKQFFTELGFSSNVPVDVQYENAFIGLSSKNWASNCNSIAMSLRGTAQDIQQQTIFSGRFNNHQEHSWAALKYFLEFLYYPAMYTKQVEMFALNQKLIDDCFDDTERFVNCGLFTWKGEIATMTADDFSESLSWLEKNICAKTILFPRDVELMDDHFYDRISIFLLDSSWKCARKEIKFEWIINLNRFLDALVKKFRSVSFVRKDTPMYTATAYANDEIKSLLLWDLDVKKLKSEDSERSDVFVISNGDTRMQIEIFKRYNYETEQKLNYIYPDEDSDDDYGYDYYAEDIVKYYDGPRKGGNECFICVKTYNV